MICNAPCLNCHGKPGATSFNHRSLHHIGHGQNPYEQAITIIGRSLSAFDEDNLIPCYGFGDGKVHPNCFLTILHWFDFAIRIIWRHYSYICQHQHMIKTSSVSIQKRYFVKDLRRCSHDTEKLFLNFDLQVPCFTWFISLFLLYKSKQLVLTAILYIFLWQDRHLWHPSLKWRWLLLSKVVVSTIFCW